MRLILIRHGQTESNVHRLLDTAMPGPGLTELGQQQAAGLVSALAEQPLDAIYSSIATRAQQTAAPLAANRELVPIIREGAREIAAGDLEMSAEMASVMAYLKVVSAWLQGDREVRMAGADTGTEVLSRFDAVVQEALEAGHNSAAIVSHGAMIRTWTACRAVNIDQRTPEKYDLSNTGVVVLEDGTGDPERPWTVTSWAGEPAGGAQLADPLHDGPNVGSWTAESR
ncbi:phosphoglycerate/bisphosphoglycerate mutase [Renibacterium salmoninarum ATCC 33209]|uniref:Phosphoglycerate/bisphosphoglycerate mutase n=1 Tax=Renibacterium salmoninarum (strain ATCC 33209 / DSM 20767 / JCM 11484 / NBRC 15589 / NCIMB 2235) TaxID=288705 RepID=A9WQE6_RENSM|nr:histidine phosphatase family protein [Renibacterium salmoninarum]ABY22596.1 phosphoglycerate/bisphosphoglycerate mutase [Renibacterium salmoninarum ATCC 33209]